MACLTFAFLYYINQKSTSFWHEFKPQGVTVLHYKPACSSANCRHCAGLGADSQHLSTISRSYWNQTLHANWNSCLTFIKLAIQKHIYNHHSPQRLALPPRDPLQWLVESIYSPLGDLYGWSVGVRLAALFLGTEHPSNQNEGDDSRGEEDESEEDRNIREANAGRWGGRCEVIRNMLTSCLWPHTRKYCIKIQ